MKTSILGIGLLVALTCHTLQAKQTTTVEQARFINEAADVEYNQAQLAQMLAPIALYPDSLLTHILIASTYPIEIVEANRWITANKNLSATKISSKLDDKDWEPSVKALVMFPDILERLSDDLSWTQQLGDAFLQSEENILESIQTLRYQAEKAGSLNKMENVEISREDKNIIIQPVKKEVIYVPYYDSRQVYGHWHWALYPPVYWDWGHRISFSSHRPFGWHSGIRISWNFFFSDFHWRNRHVVVINHKNTRHYRPKKQIVRSGYAKRWVHKPEHRKGVRYSNYKVSKRYNHNRPVVYKNRGNHHTQVNVKNNVIINKNNGHKTSRKEVSRHEALNNKFKAQRAYQKEGDRKQFKAKSANDKRNSAYDKKREMRNKGNHTSQKQFSNPAVKQQRQVKQTREIKSVKKERAVKRERSRDVKPKVRAERVETRRTNNNHRSANNQAKRKEHHTR